MEDQQIYKTHLASNSSDSLYYQQLQHQSSTQVLQQSYDSIDMNASESSPSSPHLSQDSRDVTSVAQVEVSRPSQWTNAGSANNSRAQSSLNCFEQSLQWNPQNNDGYQATYYPQHDNHPKTASGALHKLDSFTQVFARQNLRIHAMSQGLPQASPLLDADSTLRQLLSHKSSGEEQTQLSTLDRYSQVSQQHQGLATQQQKHSLQQMQSHFYYEYLQPPSQAPTQSFMQQGHQFGQQVQSQQVLQQHQQESQKMQYYTQQNSGGQQRSLTQEMQTRQFSGQMSQYYPMQAAEMHHNIQQTQQHHMQLQHQSYNADCTAKVDNYQQDHSQNMQLIQLGSVPQYVYQNSQTLRHPYKQSLTSQQHLQQEVSPQKQYNMENGQTVVMDSPLGLPSAEQLDTNYNQEALGILANTNHQQVLTVDNSYVLGNQGLHHSPNTAWPQLVPDSQTVSPHNRISKTQLTCSVCFKEFKSLPALNGHLRSHGGVRTSTGLKQEEGEKSQSREAENLTPIVMPVSVPVKLAPPEPNAQPVGSRAEQLVGCASDDEMPILTKMTFTPPSSPKVVSSCASSDMVKTHHQSGKKLAKPEDHTKPHQERRKYRHRPEPLFIPPPSFNANTSHSGATLYQSQLRSPRIIGETLLGGQELPTYTPPPMLSPVRQGSGLFSSVITAAHNAHLPLTPLTPTPRVLLCRSNSIDGTGATVTPGPGEHTVDVEPRINIGSRFQAEIPYLQCRSSLMKESHKATLVWKPWPELEKEESKQRVEVFLSMSCSSVLPGGGNNLEYALHSLFEANGNIVSALDMLLLKDMPRLTSHPLADYHYAGSDFWNNTEKKSFNKALITCNKDFFHVQKMIRTKTVSQCVEYYYTWKKILHMGRRQRTRLVELNEDDTTSVDDVDDEEQEVCDRAQKSPNPVHAAEVDNAVTGNLAPPVGSFVCEMGNCGATFCSRQALNGHARIHAGTSVHNKAISVAGTGRQKAGTQTGYCSVKSSPAHSTTSGETDTTSVFPCKICGKVFYKIKSRNAHMKTHRQQEEQQKQKAQKAAMAAHMADTIARTPRRTNLPTDSIMLFDHFGLLKTTEEDFDDDVAQDLQDVLEETEVMRSYLLLDDEDVDLLQDGADL